MPDLSVVLLFLFILFLIAGIVFLRITRPRRIVIFEYQRGALFLKGAFKQIVGSGHYWSTKARQFHVVDTRLQALNVAGQEVLTIDGLSLKITLAAEYRIVDPALYLLSSTAPASLLYQDAQQALREAAAGLSFESILETRAAINARMLQLLVPLAARLGLEVSRIELRDIILPGELKRAYAQEISAKREGAAALERARGETAALRSLANAARLMQDHPGLLQLRAVQAIESSKGNTLTLELLASPEKARE